MSNQVLLNAYYALNWEHFGHLSQLGTFSKIKRKRHNDQISGMEWIITIILIGQAFNSASYYRLRMP